MTKAVLSVRIESDVLAKFDAMATFFGQTRSGFLNVILSDYVARNYDAPLAELSREVDVLERDKGGSDDPD